MLLNKLTLSVIIVNYNGENYLKNCLGSIITTCKNINHEIIILDNCSNDKSVELIESNYPQVKLIKSKENLGFGRGNNLAVSNSEGRYILLLNNDTVLLHDLLPAINIIKKKDIGAVGIKMVDKNKNFKTSTGYFPSPFNLVKLSFLNTNRFKFKKEKEYYEVDWIEGSFILTKRELWENVHGFDKRFFMYVEDVDLCKEIENLNKKRVFFPKIAYMHYGGFNLDREGLLISGHKMFVEKHYKGLYKNLCLFSLYLNKTYKKLLKKNSING